MQARRSVLRGLVALLLGAVALPAAADPSRVDLPSIALGEAASLAKAKGEGCVEPTDVIRSDHMKFLLHQRDQTVIEGIRTQHHSLKECVQCHASVDDGGEYMPIDSEGQFCESCHDYASVSLDCFDCHATRPAKRGAVGDP